MTVSLRAAEQIASTVTKHMKVVPAIDLVKDLQKVDGNKSYTETMARVLEILEAIPKPVYVITPTIERGISRTGGLEGITAAEITLKLGITPRRYKRGDGDGKVTREWCFKIKGKTGFFGIWDYKAPARDNIYWSTYGDPDTLRELFGEKYTR